MAGILSASCKFWLAETFGEYYDYERFGKDRAAREHGVFDEAGYIAYNGMLGFDEIMYQDKLTVIFMLKACSGSKNFSVTSIPPY